MNWRAVSKEEAIQNRSYGLTGWLLLLWILNALHLLVSLLALLSTVLTDVREIHPVVPAVYVLLMMPFAVLGLMKHSATPYVTIGCVWAYFILTPFLSFLGDPMPAESILPYIIISVVVGGSLTAYFLRSKRVNVTFLSRVPAINELQTSEARESATATDNGSSSEHAIKND